MAEDIFAGHSEVPAIGIINKDMSPVRQEAADELGLVRYNITVPLFSLPQCFLRSSNLFYLLAQFFFS